LTSPFAFPFVGTADEMVLTFGNPPMNDEAAELACLDPAATAGEIATAATPADVKAAHATASARKRTDRGSCITLLLRSESAGLRDAIPLFRRRAQRIPSQSTDRARRTSGANTPVG
jgi:hypothetical protein